MNLDLLIKLVKLANNNPNENEANQAARKVCVMIEEAKFKFGADLTNPYRPLGDIHSVFVRQQQEAQAKYYNDFINAVFNMRKDVK